MADYGSYRYEDEESEELRKKLAELGKTGRTIGSKIGLSDERQFSKKKMEEYEELEGKLKARRAALKKLTK